MKVCLVALAALALSACCLFGGQLTDGPEIDLGVTATWAGETPPPGSVATVSFYVMAESVGSWTLVQAGVPYPQDAGALVDTFWYAYEVPTTGEKVTYRYEVGLVVGGEVYNFVCESAVWWWYAAGEVQCSEREG